MKTVLVTGGAGYMGAHTCKVLSISGLTPIVYENLVNGNRESVKWGPFEFDDVLGQVRLTEVMKIYL